MKVTCNKCGAEFEAVTLDEYTDNGWEIRYFACPECKAVYIISVKDDALKKDISRLVRMSKRYSRDKISGKPITEKRVQRILNLYEANKIRGKELKREYYNYLQSLI